MTYEAVEASVADARPYFLYLFDDGETPIRKTSEPEDLVRMGETWESSPIAHGDIEQSGNVERANVDIILPNTDTLGRIFLVPDANKITTVTVWRGHHTDPDQNHRVVWKGRVVGAKSLEQIIKVSVESAFTSLKRTGCRVRYQRTCRHALYFDGCNLNREDFEIPAYITAISGLTLTYSLPMSSISGYSGSTGNYDPDAFVNDFLGGIVDYNGALGFVVQQSGNQLTLITPIAGLEDAVDQAISLGDPGAVVFLLPGCRLTGEYCQTRFDNILNFGGFRYMPDNNPFSISIA